MQRLYYPIGADERYSKTVRDCLDDWDQAFPVLAGLATEIAEGRYTDRALVGVILTPVQYPDKLLEVGANYSGHLAEMGLEVKK